MSLDASDAFGASTIIPAGSTFADPLPSPAEIGSMTAEVV